MIKFLLIFVGLLFLFGCANTYMKSKRVEQPTKFEAAVVHSIEPDSKEVRILEDVFSWGREAIGEYFYFAEIESSALKSDGTGDLSKADYFAEVTVSFESDVLKVAKADLQTLLSGEYDSFDSNFKVGGVALGDMSPVQLHTFLKAPEYVSVISTGNDEFKTFNADGFFNTVFFRAILIEHDRVREIKVWSKSKHTDVNWLYAKFTTLVSKYQSIPINRFTGSKRQ